MHRSVYLLLHTPIVLVSLVPFTFINGFIICVYITLHMHVEMYVQLKNIHGNKLLIYFSLIVPMRRCKGIYTQLHVDQYIGRSLIMIEDSIIQHYTYG